MAKLILQSGGTPVGELVDVVISSVAARTASRPPIALAVSQIQRHLGATLDDQPNQSALTADLARQCPHRTRLYPHRSSNQRSSTCNFLRPASLLAARPGTRDRPDRRGRARLRIQPLRQHAAHGAARHRAPSAAAESAVRARLLALGYSEAISSSFASELDGATFAVTNQQTPRGVVALENPLSDEAGLLRPSLAPGMLAMLAHNLNRDVRDVRLFEQGTIFTGTAEQVVESPSLSLGLTGTLLPTSLYSAKDAAVFELKGVVESLLSLFAASSDALSTSAASALTFSPDAPAWLDQVAARRLCSTEYPSPA